MPTNDSRQTKAERREAARAEALAMRQAQERRDKRNRIITISTLGVGLAALVAIFLAIWLPAMNQKREDAQPKSLSEVTAPATANDSGGIPIGKSGEAGTDNGKDAVEVGVYLDYMCPACGAFESTNGQSLDEMREAGDVTVVLHPIAILDRMSRGTEFSTRSAAAAAYIADQAPDSLSQFTTLMFDNQPQENSSGLTNEQIATIAEQAGVAKDIAAKIGDGTAAETFGPWVRAATDTSTADADLGNPDQGGNFTTPTITVGGDRWNENWSDPARLKAAVVDAQG